MQVVQILVIEDETDLQDAMVSYLGAAGFDAIGFSSVEAAESWLRHGDTRLIVLDLGLKGESGLDWLKRRPDLREKGIIIVTASGSPEQRIAGREAGADEYLVKPLPLAELSITAANLLERINPAKAWDLNRTTWSLGAPNGDVVKLTASELTVVSALAESPGEPVARDDLIRALGHDPLLYDYRRMEILIRRLRNKVHKETGVEAPIETIRAVGYAFAAPISSH